MHHILWLLCVFWGCPLDVVALALEPFQLLRTLKVWRAFSAWRNASRAASAGSKFGNRLLKVVRYLPLDLV